MGAKPCEVGRPPLRDIVKDMVGPADLERRCCSAVDVVVEERFGVTALHLGLSELAEWSRTKVELSTELGIPEHQRLLFFIRLSWDILPQHWRSLRSRRTRQRLHCQETFQTSSQEFSVN